MGLLVLNVELAGGTSDIGLRDRAVGDLAVTMPVFHISRDNRGLRAVGGDVGVGTTVDGRLETEHEGLNGPLELNKMDAVRRLVEVLGLATVNTDKGEGNTVNEDVVDLREDEHVVDVEVERRDLRSRERRRR